VAENFGLAPIAASTHPFAHWQVQRHTDKQRYQMLSRDMQSLARRMLICGMHVHVGIEDDELRVHLLNQFTHFLPLLLALSTSSPFWEGQKTGLMSYRLPVFDTFPRTGLPERFASFAEYQQQVAILQKSGVIEDATVIWWDLRPSARYPTLEMRITDVCTRLDDAASLAALTQCTLHHLYHLRMKHQSWQVYPRFLVDQNRWRAMRYGYDEGLVDFASGDVVPVEEMVIELVEMLREDAEALGCVLELAGVLEILKRGTSAHRQINVYEDSLAAGADEAEALKAVVDMLISESVFSVF
jgi:carboxylate-amine ligase